MQWFEAQLPEAWQLGWRHRKVDLGKPTVSFVQSDTGRAGAWGREKQRPNKT